MKKPAPDHHFLRCPRCAQQMVKETHPNAVIDRCEGCNGLFFDAGEMRALLGASADEKEWIAAARGGEPGIADFDCPRCTRDMAVRQLEQGDLKVEVDQCTTCGGLWLDGGEVDTVMRIGAKRLAKRSAKGARSQHSDDANALFGALDLTEDPS